MDGSTVFQGEAATELRVSIQSEYWSHGWLTTPRSPRRLSVANNSGSSPGEKCVDLRKAVEEMTSLFLFCFNFWIARRSAISPGLSVDLPGSSPISEPKQLTVLHARSGSALTAAKGVSELEGYPVYESITNAHDVKKNTIDCRACNLQAIGLNSIACLQAAESVVYNYSTCANLRSAHTDAGSPCTALSKTCSISRISYRLETTKCFEWLQSLQWHSNLLSRIQFKTNQCNPYPSSTHVRLKTVVPWHRAAMVMPQRVEIALALEMLRSYHYC